MTKKKTTAAASLGSATTTSQTTIAVAPGSITPTMIVVQYSTPAGNQPKTFGQWIGLWQGPLASYTVPPVTSVQVTTNNSQGTVAVPVTLLRSTTYSVGYVMGPQQTTLAATFTFTT